MISLAAIGFGACLATSANAQDVCLPHATVVDRLATKFGEVQKSVGLSGRGDMMETYANPKTGTWTILLTRPDGVTCYIATGLYWAVEAPGVPT